MLRLLLIVGLIALLLCLYWYLRSKVVQHRPSGFTLNSGPAAGKKIITCVGDSLTQGNMGVNYVAMLERWLGQTYRFCNMGVNGDLTFTLLERLDEIIATRPDYLILLIGTNDINATTSEPTLRRYWKIKKIPTGLRPDFDGFQQNYIRLVERLRNETDARLALVSLPVLGEDMENEPNQKADQYSLFIKELAARQGLTYLPVRERMKAFLEAHPKPVRHSFGQTYTLMNVSMARYYLLGHSWDTIARSFGHDITHDNLHLTTRGAAIIATEVEQFLKEEAQPLTNPDPARQLQSSGNS